MLYGEANVVKQRAGSEARLSTAIIHYCSLIGCTLCMRRAWGSDEAARCTLLGVSAV